jgi:S1/P1 Nuclease
MKAMCFAFLFALVPLEQALAWGQEGYSIVAEIGERRLDTATLGKIRAALESEAPSIIGPQVSLASIASWADDYRAQHKETSNWHFVDIPYERGTYDPAQDCKPNPQAGDCLINAIERSRVALADCSMPPRDRTMALKFLVHFVGDIHQPLHAAERNGDHGGNDVMVTFFGKPMNLHALWDTGLIMHTVFAWGAYVARLETGWFPGRDLTSLAGGKPVDWAVESHKFAHDVAYDLPPDNVLESAYYAKSLPVVDRQLALGGVRLARFLRETLRPTASCP